MRIQFGIWKLTVRTVLYHKYFALCFAVLLAVGCFMGILSDRLILQQEQALADFVRTCKIQCVVTDCKGMNQNNLKMDTNTARILQTDPLYQNYIADLQLLAVFPLVKPAKHMARGILSLSSDSDLDVMKSVQVSFYPGYTEEILRSDERVVLLPEHLLSMWPDGVVVLERIPGETVELKIAGIIYGIHEDIYYIPYNMDWSETVTTSTTVRQCSFTIRDNTKLEEAKSILYGELFQIPDKSNWKDDALGLLVQDEIFQETTEQMVSNLRLLHLLQPLLLALMACVGFFASYLSTRTRVKEFAVMRCLGLKQRRVFVLVFLEFLLLTAAGSGLGLLAGCVAEGGVSLPGLGYGGLLVGVFLLGSAVATWRVTRVNVMILMKVED